MAVEILTVSLDDYTIEKLADVVAARVASAMSSATFVPSAPQAAPPAQQPPEDDPWVGTDAAPQQEQSWPQQQPQQTQQPQQGASQGQAPRCAHGEMRYVPGGFSRNTNRAYGAFYGCPTPRGTPNQCKPVKA